MTRALGEFRARQIDTAGLYDFCNIITYYHVDRYLIYVVVSSGRTSIILRVRVEFISEIEKRKRVFSNCCYVILRRVSMLEKRHAYGHVQKQRVCVLHSLTRSLDFRHTEPV